MGNVQSSFVERQVFPTVKNVDPSMITKWLDERYFVLEKNVLHYTPYNPKFNTTCFVYLHGNAEDALSVEIFQQLKCYKLIAYEYPGYGVRQDETIDESKFIAGVEELSLWLKENVAEEKNIVVCGRSLGTFFATQLAHSLQKRCSKLVLASPMISAIATKISSPFYRLFYMADMINTERFIEEVFDNPTCKTLIIHGTDDDVVPVTHADVVGQRLREKGSLSVEIRRIQNAGHNDIFRPYTIEILRSFLAS